MKTVFFGTPEFALPTLERLLESRHEVVLVVTRPDKPDGRRKVYRPALAPGKARRNALQHVIDTFFGGSSRMLVGTLIDLRRDDLTDEDVARLTQMVESASED